MTRTSETGCNNNKKGFTLIEILVVIVLISIASSLIFINFNSVVSVAKNQSTFTKSFSYLSEESIVSGNIIGWHANNERQFFYFMDTNSNVVTQIENPYSRN
ncbi:MAG: type II secretion system protein, partial [Proteobacteria bacterium]|nr:type II secretion system protein [Pseudomonadota bacterium]